ncbi:MAG: cytochrome bd ubiquinol oxidase subunit [Myxococcales bacterium]|jgi:cytochrome d ubiquinol oxidase subunit I|nr:cytochrome bd ubiquinol oxidase subunit [Myxococcales bacterium]
MDDPLIWHRLQFAFTIIYHYLFPQLTMGLALLIALLKWRALRSGNPMYNDAARFWIRIFGINFAVGVVTGIPMEFQFGTNWARFTTYSGGVVGHTLGMEGMFAFFLESSFLGLVIWGEKRLSPRAHLGAALALWIGSWLSGYFIVATNGFMQHPVGHVVGSNGTLQLESFWTFLLNPWSLAAYAHTMVAAVVTASFVMTALGAYWTLGGVHQEQGRLNLRWGCTAGLVASVLVAFPTGDHQAKLVARHQPVALAAMEGRFESGPRAEINLIGQPDVQAKRLDNPLRVPAVLSILAFGYVSADVRGLDAFPRDQWPTSIELLFYSFHIMAGLGTLFIALMALAVLQDRRGKLPGNRGLLWTLMLAFPFPYIATTMGWMTAELGRQPWLVWGLMRTRDGSSATVHSGSAAFTLIGFCGLYFVLGLLFVFLVGREVSHGPRGAHDVHAAPSPS